MRFFSLVAVLLLPSLAYGQSCESGFCLPRSPVVLFPSHSDQNLQAIQRQVASVGSSSSAAVRVSVRGGCGSGSVVGRYKTGSLVLTNAHVAGTRPGSRSVIRCRHVNSEGVMADFEYQAVLLEAAYSDRFLTDWAVLYADKLTAIEPVRLSKEKPRREMYTRGSPGCVWPLRDSGLTVADIRDGSTLVRWRPSAIGGQSGSGCWDSQDNSQRAILTWQWGGLGAGQQTAEIYRQSLNKTVAGHLRTGGEIELSSTGVAVEVGYFAASGLNDFDIWIDDDATPPPSDSGMTDEQRAEISAAVDQLDVIRTSLQKVLSE